MTILICFLFLLIECFKNFTSCSTARVTPGQILTIFTCRNHSKVTACDLDAKVTILDPWGSPLIRHYLKGSVLSWFWCFEEAIFVQGFQGLTILNRQCMSFYKLISHRVA